MAVVNDKLVRSEKKSLMTADFDDNYDLTIKEITYEILLYLNNVFDHQRHLGKINLIKKNFPFVSLYVWAGRKCAGGGGGGRGGMLLRKFKYLNNINLQTNSIVTKNTNKKSNRHHTRINENGTVSLKRARDDYQIQYFAVDTFVIAPYSSSFILHTGKTVSKLPKYIIIITKRHQTNTGRFIMLKKMLKLFFVVILVWIVLLLTLLRGVKNGTMHFLDDKKVWMDDYAKYFYERINYRKSDFGDISARKEMRKKLRCKSFQWYLKNIYPEMQLPDDQVARGQIMSRSELCLDAPNRIKMGPAGGVKIVKCHFQGGNQYWVYSIDGELRRDDMCLDYIFHTVTILPCKRSASQIWLYDLMNKIKIRKSKQDNDWFSFSNNPTVLEFVDEHGNEVLNLGSFTLLPQHVVRLILARDELRADEFTKFQAALMWSKKYCDTNPNINLKEVIGNFLEYIQFHKIPANVLMREVHPLGLVPYSIIMNALAYQADPASIDPGKLSPARVRRAGRSMSVQSSLDPYGSNTTLSSTGSSDVPSSDSRHN
ncbi:hypothetical protein MSG28_010121 [Choristoneura fumiferana]|uniref:Uncharacterized protein n=1 Tax=Choristoneura fumiferana TaxID=7141 RepID=A0ACC0KKL1_CHOFU|nr:hypothetical protein MSG28_010121 [Choristoneura fumiferana]